MDIKEKSIIYEKRIECSLGILFLVPPLLGVFFFLLTQVSDLELAIKFIA